MKRNLFFTIALMIGAATAATADDGLPRGKWWNRPEVSDRLALTLEQKERLDDVFQKSATELIDLKAEVEKRNVDLRARIDSETLNREEIQRAASRASEARARLFERELMMLVDLRNVLTADQWRGVRTMIEQRGMQQRQQRPMRPRMDRRPQRRRP